MILNKNFALYYHAWVPNGSDQLGLFIVDEQIKRIIRSGLHDICDVRCCLASPSLHILEYLQSYPWLHVIAAGENHLFEGLTLQKMWQASFDERTFRKVGYLHTKGMRYFTSSLNGKAIAAVNGWRHFLEKAIIDHHKALIAKLDTFQVTGILYKTYPWEHFVGNMWWADASYVRSLSDPCLHEGSDMTWASSTDQERLKYERWICSGSPRTYSFFDPPFARDGKIVFDENINLYEEDISDFTRHDLFA